MTVGQMIEKLQQFDQHLPICTADAFEDPDEKAAECVQLIRDDMYWSSENAGYTKGDYVCIGDPT